MLKDVLILGLLLGRHFNLRGCRCRALKLTLHHLGIYSPLILRCVVKLQEEKNSTPSIKRGDHTYSGANVRSSGTTNAARAMRLSPRRARCGRLDPSRTATQRPPAACLAAGRAWALRQPGACRSRRPVAVLTVLLTVLRAAAAAAAHPPWPRPCY